MCIFCSGNSISTATWAIPILYTQKDLNQYQRQKIPALFWVKLTSTKSHPRCDDSKYVWVILMGNFAVLDPFFRFPQDTLELNLHDFDENIRQNPWMHLPLFQNQFLSASQKLKQPPKRLWTLTNCEIIVEWITELLFLQINNITANVSKHKIIFSTCFLKQ